MSQHVLASNQLAFLLAERGQVHGDFGEVSVGLHRFGHRSAFEHVVTDVTKPDLQVTDASAFS